jgi:hypothetical protein
MDQKISSTLELMQASATQLSRRLHTPIEPEIGRSSMCKVSYDFIPGKAWWHLSRLLKNQFKFATKHQLTFKI